MHVWMCGCMYVRINIGDLSVIIDVRVREAQ